MAIDRAEISQQVNDCLVEFLHQELSAMPEWRALCAEALEAADWDGRMAGALIARRLLHTNRDPEIRDLVFRLSAAADNLFEVLVAE